MGYPCDTIVTFNYATWQSRYPEFQGVSQELAQEYFNEACLYCVNDGSGPIRNPAQLAPLLNMLTAHIAALYATANGEPVNPLVGRISNATQGSVSVSSDMDIPAGSEQWFAQTKYGFSYWQATAAFRTMHYLPGPERVFDEPPWGWGWV